MVFENHTPTAQNNFIKNIENVEITDIAEEGAGVGKTGGFVLFVDYAVPGDIVDVEIYKKKKNFAKGKIGALRKSSPFRETPFCKHFIVCGGCKQQHISYEGQLKLKQKAVCDVLERVGKIDTRACEPILPSEHTKYYRNKLEYTFSQDCWIPRLNRGMTPDSSRGMTPEFNQVSRPPALGFHVPGRFDKILNIEECFLQPEPSNEIRNAVREFALKQNYSFYHLKNHTGELRNLVIRTSSLAEIMVAVVFAYAEHERITLLMDFLKHRFPQITSLLYIINQKKNDTLFDQHIHVYAGSDCIFESMPRLENASLSIDVHKEPLKFKIGLKSFYQTNSKQAYELYKIVAEFANFQGNELVYDLYTGAGTIANFIANSVKQVVGIDFVESAIQDAILNSKNNNISNTLFYAGDMKDTLNENFVSEHGKPDVVIVDPPRAGLHPDVVKCLLEMESPKIVYVSCNPATQARDLTFLTQKYRISRIKPVDMFPHTQHVENVVLLVI